MVSLRLQSPAPRTNSVTNPKCDGPHNEMKTMKSALTALGRNASPSCGTGLQALSCRMGGDCSADAGRLVAYDRSRKIHRREFQPPSTIALPPNAGSRKASVCVKERDVKPGLATR